MKRGASRVSTPRTALPKQPKAPVPGYPPGPAARGVPVVKGLNQPLVTGTPNTQSLTPTRRSIQYVTSSKKPGRSRVPGG